MFNDRLMSPVERVTMAFMPSGVMSMLSVKNRFLNMHESKLGKYNVWFYLFKVVSCATGQSLYKMCVCVKSFFNRMGRRAGSLQPGSFVFRVF